MTTEYLMVLLCILWFVLLLVWFLTNSVMIATLFFGVWISWRYVIRKFLMREKEFKK